MKSIFSLDSPFMQGLSTMADIMILNLITVIFCIPLVTAGASFTAAHYVALKMVRNEESYIVKDFWKSFKLNFKQATKIWIVVLLIVIILAADLYIVLTGVIKLPSVIVALILAATAFACVGIIYIFPVLSKFENKTLTTIKNAFLFSILNLPKSILMLIIYAMPIFITIMVWQLFPLVMLMGIAAPIYFSAMLYNKMFLKMENLATPGIECEEVEIENEDDKIFHDQSYEE